MKIQERYCKQQYCKASSVSGILSVRILGKKGIEVRFLSAVLRTIRAYISKRHMLQVLL